MRFDPETAQTIISGMGELHLEIIIDRLLREFKVEANVGRPQVAYRETIRKAAKARGRYIRQTGGRGQYGDVTLKWSRCSAGAASSSWTRSPAAASRGSISRRCRPGIREAAEGGVLAGLSDGRRARDADRRVVPRRGLLRDGVQDRRVNGIQVRRSMRPIPVLLEPVMKVEAVTPEQYMGDVIGDLNARRGRIMAMEQRGALRIVQAEVPLSKMFGYATVLRSNTQGRATYTMEFSHYEEVPKNIAEELMAKTGAGNKA